MLAAKEATGLVALTLAEASRAIAVGELSPVDLVDAYLDRITEVDDRLHSYITVLGDSARGKARRAEAEIQSGKRRGPLHGIPYAVKDNYAAKGARMTVNSRLYLDNVPQEDATAIRKLEEAGAILLGKLSTWEFGTGTGEVFDDLPFPLARNPWSLDCYAGGSSTGAGACVPARTAMFALGSDTGGSIRLPAAACGLQGLKATSGLISRHGIFPNCWAFDVAGPLCWNVEDCAWVADAISGFDPADASSVDRKVAFSSALDKGVKGLRIGFIPDLDLDGVHPHEITLQHLAEAARVLEDLGAEIVETALPAPLRRYRDVTSVINWAESYAIHEKDFQERWSLMGQAVRDKMMAGLSLSAVDYLAAQRDRRTLAEMTDALVSQFDALLLPCTFAPAPLVSDAKGVAALISNAVTTPFNVSAHPALTVCTGFDARGLPTSAQIVAGWFEDATALRVGAAYEKATPWRRRFPAI